jgi:prepilin-type N-terminal cleavage/methylation domain-containing protein
MAQWLRARIAAARTDERGLTLSELIVAIAVLGIIITPLTAAMLVFIKSGTTTVPVYESNIDARLVSARWQVDAQSAELIDTGAICGTDGVAVVNFHWVDDVSSDRDVSYVVRTLGTKRSFIRNVCTNGTLDSSVTLIDSLGPTNTPSFSCTPDCDAPDTITLDVRDGNNYRYALTADFRVATA